MADDMMAMALNAAAQSKPSGVLDVSGLTATWVGGNKTYWPPPVFPQPSFIPYVPPQKSDAPYMMATLAQLLDEGKISEDTFARLAERLIQQVR